MLHDDVIDEKDKKMWQRRSLCCVRPWINSPFHLETFFLGVPQRLQSEFFSTMSFVSWDIINFAFLKPFDLSSLLTHVKQLLPHLNIWGFEPSLFKSTVPKSATRVTITGRDKNANTKLSFCSAWL